MACQWTSNTAVMACQWTSKMAVKLSKATLRVLFTSYSNKVKPILLRCGKKPTNSQNFSICLFASSKYESVGRMLSA